MEISDRDLVRRSCIEVSCKDLARKCFLFWSLYRGLAKRFVAESWAAIFLRDLFQRSCVEVSYRHLVQWPCTEINERDSPQRSQRREPTLHLFAQDLLHIFAKGSCTAVSTEIPSVRSWIQSSIYIDIRDLHKGKRAESTFLFLAALFGFSCWDKFSIIFQSIMLHDITHTGGRIHTPSCFDWKL